jgi:hypothetical protein
VPAHGLEFVLYSRDGLADPRGPAFQLNVNTGPRMEHDVGYDPDAEPRFWFVIDVDMAREGARPLAGRPPIELLPALPRALVLSALRDSLAWHRDHDSGEAVLAACRAWAWATEERWLSKSDAGAWAAARIQDPAPVAKALARRADQAALGPSPRDVEVITHRVEPLLDAGADPAPA